MTEILTESFCERCGTRYTFESVAPKQRRIGGIKTLGRGLKNFVMSDDSSLDEAMAAARSDAERESTAQQLDAFHRTFNFCMSCRQYTCGNCWNGVEARCLSCAPMATDLVTPEAEAEAAVDLDRLMRLMQPQAEPDWSPAAEAPELVGSAEAAAHAGVDVPEAVEAEAEAEAEELAPPAPADEQFASGLPAWATTPPRSPEVEVPAEAATAEFAPDAAPLEEPAAAVAESAAAVPESALGLEPEPEPAEAAVVGLEPGESLEDAIAAYEASLQAASAAPAAPEAPVVEAPAAALGASEAPVAEVASAADVEVPAAAEVELPAGPGPGVDLVEQPTWPIPTVRAQPELAPEPEPEVQVTVAEPAPPEVAAPEVAAPEVPAPEPAAPTPAPIPVEPEPQPFPVAATSAPAAEPESPPVPPAPARPTAPALPTFAQPPTPAGPPQWPTGPRWPTGIPARESLPTPAAAPGPAGADPLAAIMARQVTEAMWAASSRDVLQPPLAAPASTAAVQPCVSCGISLSATARFCRRCGTPQSA